MDRIYVIMEDCYNYDPYDGEKDSAEPIDFCTSMTEAEELCVKYEAAAPERMYYWREVIKGGE